MGLSIRSERIPLTQIMSVDTTSNAGSVAVSCDTRLLGCVETDSTESHSLRLFAAIEFLLSQLHLALDQIDAYAVTTGPGSFAGLRIGVATVKGLAEMHHKAIIPVSTLEAIAASGTGIGDGERIIAVMDARRSELYSGAYSRHGDDFVNLEADCIGNVQGFFGARDRSPAVFVGPEIETFASFIQASADRRWTMRTTTRFLAPAVAVLAHRKFATGKTVTPDQLSIHYIRRSDAEMMFKG
jgi:tRNA threonylcarbamoyladenosine biosynthesis protein TsaB